MQEEPVFVAHAKTGSPPEQGLSGARATGETVKGHRLDPQQFVDVRFGPIWDTPFGTRGDLMIVPDPAAEVRVDFDDDLARERFFLGDICTNDGTARGCCPRTFLRRALANLEATAGLRLVAAFEQEVVYTGATNRPSDAYALGAFRRAGEAGRSSPLCVPPG